MNNFKTKQMKKLSLIIIIIPLLFGCSKNLSREDAAKSIKQKYNLPADITQDFQFTQNQEVNYTIPFNYTAVGEKAYYDEERNFTKRKEAAQNAKLGDIQKLPIFEALEKDGLIIYSTQVINTSVAKADMDLSSPGNLGPKYHNNFGGTFYNFKCIRTIAHIATPTEKGKKYITNDNKVIVATEEFGEVTGIIESKESKSAEVNYTIRRINITPFGRIVFNLNEETYNKSETFTKYDDGWRINK